MQRLLVLCLLAFAGVAHADRVQVKYVGVHPIPKAEGGGTCFIEGPHVHIFAVADKLQYRDHGGAWFFVGDPVAYGYDGPRTAFKGPHPIHVDVVVGDATPDEEYCYLTGPHFHAFAPVASPEWKVVGETYFFVGEPPKAFIDARPRYVGINAEYQPLVYARPVVNVEAPEGWIGARVDVIAPVVQVQAPVVRVEAPVIDVRIPTPSFHLGVDVGVGVGVGMGGGGGHHGHGRHR
jgi:hypothetical protein